MRKAIYNLLYAINIILLIIAVPALTFTCLHPLYAAINTIIIVLLFINIIRISNK